MTMMAITMRLLRFFLLWTTAWAAQWQQTPHTAMYPPQLYSEAAAAAAQSQEQVHYSSSPAHLYSAQQQTVVVSNKEQQEQQQEQQQDEIPTMELEHVSLSLRLTCEMNRRLLQGIRNNNNHALHHSKTTRNNNNHNPLLQRGGDGTGIMSQHHPVNIHPSQFWQPPIASGKSNTDDDEQLTLFHAKSPRTHPPQRRGVARWGPELLIYLKYLVETVFEIPSHQQSILLALSLVYLDRACSVETIRTSGCPKCPFVTPRTVHRLLLIALLTATRAISSLSTNDSVSQLLGIPSRQLEQMQHAFMHALGDNGLHVDPMQLQQFMNKWQSKFHSSS